MFLALLLFFFMTVLTQAMITSEVTDGGTW